MKKLRRAQLGSKPMSSLLCKNAHSVHNIFRRVPSHCVSHMSSTSWDLDDRQGRSPTHSAQGSVWSLPPQSWKQQADSTAVVREGRGSTTMMLYPALHQQTMAHAFVHITLMPRVESGPGKRQPHTVPKMKRCLWVKGRITLGYDSWWLLILIWKWI